MAMHLPVNHPLRPFYRTLAFAAGVFVLVFGIVGFIQTQGTAFFGVGDETALGLSTNLGFSVASIVAGVAILLATFMGRNVDRFVYLWAGTGFMAVGIVMMMLIGKRDLNYLNFTMTTCVVSLIIGSVLGTAGLYVKAQRA